METKTSTNGYHHEADKANHLEKHEEYQYLKLIEHIIDKGSRKDDRTGTGILSVFGHQARYSLRDSKFCKFLLPF